MKKYLLITLLVIIPSLLFGQEHYVFQGEKKSNSLADAFLFSLSIGPVMPKKEFEKLSLPSSTNERYDSAEYRATFARYEIYVYLNVDLIGIFEDLDRKVITTYNVPLESALDFDRGNIEFVEWLNYDKFVIKCSGLKPEFKASIKIMSGGKFEIKKL